MLTPTALEYYMLTMDWIHLAQDRDWWKSLVNMVMNLWVSKNAVNFLTS